MIAEPTFQSPPVPSSPYVGWLNAHHATEKFHIRICDVGLGVFASRDLAPGENILAIEGPIIDFAETKRRGPRECMAIQIGPDRYIDTQPPGVFVNHSCEPNAGIRQNQNLVALRKIRPGQEIRYDYSTTMEEDSFVMQCLCGAPTCREWVRDFSTLPQPVRERYLVQDIVMDFILKTQPAEHQPCQRGRSNPRTNSWVVRKSEPDQTALFKINSKYFEAQNAE
jgi:hypothetical protein